MSAVTEIAWTDRTWNPIRGCSLVSEGCRSCYAMKQAHRFSGPGKPYEGLTRLGPKGPTWTGIVRTVESALLEPLSWRKPSKVFVNSMSDLFHEDVPDQFITDVFGVMALAHWHTFQVLTKRPERMRAFLAAGDHGIIKQFSAIQNGGGIGPRGMFQALDVKRRDGIEWQWPLLNVWLGVSVENQHFADERIPLLLQTPAAVRFISAEPLLGPVDLDSWPKRCWLHVVGSDGAAERDRLDWVIVGGESGPGARPCDLESVRSIVEQCHAARVPVFVKQLGADPRGSCDWEHHHKHPPTLLDKDGCNVDVGRPPFTLQHAVGDAYWPCRLKLKDRKGGDPSEWPEYFRRREFPKARA